MVIRKATQSDLAMIDRMIPKVFKESMDTKINLTDETMQSMSRALVHQGAAYYIFVEDGKVKGFILIDFKKDDIAQHDYGFIYELYVIDIYRNQRIGESLLNFVEKIFQDHDMSEIRLNVYANNFAKLLYQKLGYQERNITMSKVIINKESQ